MQSFEIKRGHGKSLEEGGLKSLMEEEFGVVNEDENKFSTYSSCNYSLFVDALIFILVVKKIKNFFLLGEKVSSWNV